MLISNEDENLIIKSFNKITNIIEVQADSIAMHQKIIKALTKRVEALEARQNDIERLP